MSDFLLELGKNSTARKLIKQLGLPIPVPPVLRRAGQPWQEQPLRDHSVIYGSAGPSPLAGVCARALAAAGAEPLVVGDAAPFAEAGEAFGRPAQRLDIDALPDILKVSALIFDATAIVEPMQLGALYEFFHPLVRALGRSGRVVVLGRPPAGAGNPESALTAAARAALEGFVRSLAKEIGKSGSTAQLLYVERGAEERVAPVLRFFLSARSAFITGQPVCITAVAAQAPGESIWVRSLVGKVALVTGAARGIGEATARLLAAEGAHVVCLDRPADDGPTSQLAREIGGSVLLADVSDPSAPAVIAGALAERHGGVDIVVHNAGVTRDKTLARMSREQWDQAVDINLAAVCRITEALHAGVLRDHGRIICLSSVAGIAGNVGQTNYAASKAGIIGFVESLAPALADRGITVNAIAPGFIETRLTAAIPMMIREAGRRLSALGQGGLPEDVGETIVFLASPGASGLTGRVLRVCGGAFIGA